MARFLIAMAFVAAILVGGAVHDHLTRARQQAACERAGGVYAQVLSGFACVKAAQR